MRGESAGLSCRSQRARGMAAAIASQRSSDEGNKSERTRKQPDHDEGTAGWLHALFLALHAKERAITGAGAPVGTTTPYHCIAS